MRPSRRKRRKERQKVKKRSVSSFESPDAEYEDGEIDERTGDVHFRSKDATSGHKHDADASSVEKIGRVASHEAVRRQRHKASRSRIRKALAEVRYMFTDMYTNLLNVCNREGKRFSTVWSSLFQQDRRARAAPSSTSPEVAEDMTLERLVRALITHRVNII
jgi:hypothetical protein